MEKERETRLNHPGGHFMIYLFFEAQKKVDHKLPFFWPKTRLSAEWEGKVDHVFKRSLATFFGNLIMGPNQRLNT